MSKIRSRTTLKSVVGAVCAMLTYHIMAMGAHYLPDGALGAALGAVIRLASAALVVFAYAAWYRRSGESALPPPRELSSGEVTPPPRELASGDKTSIVAFAALCGVFLQFAAVAAVALITHSESFGVREAPGDPVSAIRFFGAVAVTPLCEEVVFRGVAFRLLDRVLPTALAALVSAVAFGLIHGDAVTAAVACCVGFLLAILVHRRGSLVPAIALHAAFNLTSYFTGYVPISPAAALAVCAPLGAAGIIALLKGKRTR